MGRLYNTFACFKMKHVLTCFKMKKDQETSVQVSGQHMTYKEVMRGGRRGSEGTKEGALRSHGSPLPTAHPIQAAGLSPLVPSPPQCSPAVPGGPSVCTSQAHPSLLPSPAASPPQAPFLPALTPGKTRLPPETPGRGPACSATPAHTSSIHC